MAADILALLDEMDKMEEFDDLLETHQWRSCQEVLRIPWHTFQRLVKFCREHTALTDSKYVSLEEKLMIFLSITGQPMRNRGDKKLWRYNR
jgi:hypothetical protein